MKRLLKPFSAIFLLLFAGGLTSCGVAQSSLQLPVRTLQSLGRTAGVNLEHQDTHHPTPQFEILEH